VTVLVKADIQPKAQITLRNKILKYQHETSENTFTPVFLQMDAKIFIGKKNTLLIQPSPKWTTSFPYWALIVASSLLPEPEFIPQYGEMNQETDLAKS